MSFFWPTTRRAETTIVGRLGRVLHWGLVIAAVGLVAAAVGAFLDHPDQALTASGVAPMLITAACLFMAGRALRYVLAGE